MQASSWGAVLVAGWRQGQAWDPADHGTLLRSQPQAQEGGQAADVQAPDDPEVQGEVSQGSVYIPATELLLEQICCKKPGRQEFT